MVYLVFGNHSHALQRPAPYVALEAPHKYVKLESDTGTEIDDRIDGDTNLGLHIPCYKFASLCLCHKPNAVFSRPSLIQFWARLAVKEIQARPGAKAGILKYAETHDALSHLSMEQLIHDILKDAGKRHLVCDIPEDVWMKHRSIPCAYSFGQLLFFLLVILGKPASDIGKFTPEAWLGYSTNQFRTSTSIAAREQAVYLLRRLLDMSRDIKREAIHMYPPIDNINCLRTLFAIGDPVNSFSMDVDTEVLWRETGYHPLFKGTDIPKPELPTQILAIKKRVLNYVKGSL